MPYQQQRYKHPKDCDCEDCLDAWAEWMEPYVEADRLAARDPERAGEAVPATDAEWAAFVNAKFPRVKEEVAP